jgi:hypothetical protein
LCSKHTDGDIDTVLRNLDNEEFHVEVYKKDKPDGMTTVYCAHQNSGDKPEK